MPRRARVHVRRAGDIRCFWRGRRSNEDSRGKERNLPKAFYISLTLDWFWNPRTKFWARTRSSFFAEVNSHPHPAYPSLNLPRDRGTHQPILLWNCYVTAAPALQIRPTHVPRKLSKRKYDGFASLRTSPTIDRISAGAEPSIFKNATDNRAIRGGLTRS